MSDARTTPAVPDAVAPPPRHPRFPLVDGTRAIAVICVVVLHAAVAGQATGGSLGGRLLTHLNVGVTIFFVISGFLLYRPFIAHRAGGPPPLRSGAYARNRFLRIYPAYVLILTVLLLIPGLTAFTGVPWWKAFGVMQTLPIGGDNFCPTLDCGLGQTWSLVVEVTFYLALPLYVLAANRLARRRAVTTWVTAELLVLGALSVVSLLVEFRYFGLGSRWVDATVLGFLPWFALGMGLAILSVGAQGREHRSRAIDLVSRRPLLPWIAAVGIYIALVLWLPASPLIFDRDTRLIAFVAFGVIGLLVLLPAIFGDASGGAPRRFLANGIVAWIGLISYGIFLWHVTPAIELGTTGAGASFPLLLAGTLAITIPVAAASYYFVERPLLRLKTRSTSVGGPQANPRNALSGSAAAGLK